MYRGGPERVTTKRRLAKPTPEPQPCTASPWSCDSASASLPSFKPHSKRVTRWLTVVAGVLQSTLLACAAGAARLCSVLQKPAMMSQRCFLQPAWPPGIRLMTAELAASCSSTWSAVSTVLELVSLVCVPAADQDAPHAECSSSFVRWLFAVPDTSCDAWCDDACLCVRLHRVCGCVHTGVALRCWLMSCMSD